MVTNSTSGIGKMVCDLKQAISTQVLGKQAPDEGGGEASSLVSSCVSNFYSFIY